MPKRLICKFCFYGKGAYYVVGEQGMERRTCPLPHDPTPKTQRLTIVRPQDEQRKENLFGSPQVAL